MENIIEIHLKTKEDYQNAYNEKILSYNLSNYILEETKGLSLTQKIKFNVKSEFYMSDEDKNNFVDMHRNNYGAVVSEIIHLRYKDYVSNILILFLGIIFIVIYTFLKDELLAQFILILGWVLIGETICNFLHKGANHRYNIARRKQIIKAKVLFEEK